MVGTKGRARRFGSPHVSYNVLLPETTISAVKELATSQGVPTAQIVRDILDNGLSNDQPIDAAIKAVKNAYPLPRYADGSTLGDQIAQKIKEACDLNVYG